MVWVGRRGQPCISSTGRGFGYSSGAGKIETPVGNDARGAIKMMGRTNGQQFDAPIAHFRLGHAGSCFLKPGRGASLALYAIAISRDCERGTFGALLKTPSIFRGFAGGAGGSALVRSEGTGQPGGRNPMSALRRIPRLLGNRCGKLLTFGKP